MFLSAQGDIKYPISWTTLGQYLEFLQRRGVTPNVASFIGATTVRVHELGEGDVDPTPAQLDRMRALVRAAMKEGALGVGSSMIYAPANYAETPELAAITQNQSHENSRENSSQRLDTLIAESLSSGVSVSNVSTIPPIPSAPPPPAASAVEPRTKAERPVSGVVRLLFIV